MAHTGAGLIALIYVFATIFDVADYLGILWLQRGKPNLASYRLFRIAIHPAPALPSGRFIRPTIIALVLAAALTGRFWLVGIVVFGFISSSCVQILAGWQAQLELEHIEGDILKT